MLRSLKPGNGLLIVAADTVALTNELQRLRSDLPGNGWFLIAMIFPG